jgi:hypothetical protein
VPIIIIELIPKVSPHFISFYLLRTWLAREQYIIHLKKFNSTNSLYFSIDILKIKSFLVFICQKEDKLDTVLAKFMLFRIIMVNHPPSVPQIYNPSSKK